jgi:hypothetical protein
MSLRHSTNTPDFGGFGWVLRLFLSLVLGHILECLELFILAFGRGGGFFGIVVDFSTIVLSLDCLMLSSV